MPITLLAMAAALAIAPNAFGQSEDECARAYEQGQRLQNAGKLTAASRSFGVCITACPAVLAKDCRAWKETCDRAIPTLSVRLRWPNQCARAPVRIAFDDDPSSVSEADAIPLDPGTHVVHLSAGGHARDERIALREGDARVVELGADEFCLPRTEVITEPGVAPAARPTPVLTYVLGGVGLAGLAAFTAFSISGFVQKGDLDSSCRPSCPDADVDRMQRTFLVGDISLSVGVVALAAATIVYLTRPSAPSTAARAFEDRARVAGWSF